MNPVVSKKKSTSTGRNPFGDKKQKEKEDKENKNVWLNVDQVANLLSIDHKVAIQFLHRVRFPWDSSCVTVRKGEVYRKDQVLKLFKLFNVPKLTSSQAHKKKRNNFSPIFPCYFFKNKIVIISSSFISSSFLYFFHSIIFFDNETINFTNLFENIKSEEIKIGC